MASSYMDRALRHRDPRFALILTAIEGGKRKKRPVSETGYLRSDIPASGDALERLRAEYEGLKGRAPAASWPSAKLERLIDEFHKKRNGESSE